MSSEIQTVSARLPQEQAVKILNDNDKKLVGKIAEAKFNRLEMNQLFSDVGLQHQYYRDIKLGNTLSDYLNWAHVKSEGGYSIWKYPLSDFKDNVENNLYFDDKKLSYRGIATSELASSFDKVFDFDGSTYNDQTTEAGSEFGTPFDILRDETDDILYIGHSSGFNGIDFEFESLGIDLALTVEYSKGASVWASVTGLQDDTQNFSRSGRILFDLPGDFSQDTVNSESKYWIRIKTTTLPTISPRVYFIQPLTSVVNLLSLNSQQILSEEWAWVYFNNYVYVAIKNSGIPQGEGIIFIASNSSQQNKENFFVSEHEYKIDYERASFIPNGFTTSQDYAPYTQGAPSLNLNINRGQSVVGPNLYQHSSTVLALTPSNTNYVFIDSTGTITTNTTGFPSGIVPIAQVTTTSVIANVVDKRSFINPILDPFYANQIGEENNRIPVIFANEIDAVTYKTGETIAFKDNIWVINEEKTTGTPSEDMGFILKRGALQDAEFIFKETDDRFDFNFPINVQGDIFHSGNLVPATVGSTIGTSSNRYGSLYLNSIIDYVNDLSFRSAGSDYLTLKTDGKVGIGTASPNEILEVKGNIRLSDEGGNLRALLYRSGLSGSPGVFSLYNGNGIEKVRFHTEAESFILGPGKLGIGTSSPSNELSVVGSADFSVAVVTPQIIPALLGTSLNLNTVGGGSSAGITIQSGNLSVNGGTTGTVIVRAGTSSTSDGGYLSLGGYPNFNRGGSVTLRGGDSWADSGNVTIRGGNAGSGKGGDVTVQGGNGGTGLGGAGSITLNTGSGGSQSPGNILFKISGTEFMRVNNTGFIGIGTSSPNEKLTVENGNMMIQGSGGTARLRFSNNGGVAQIESLDSGIDLAFETQAIEKMRIKASGFVGIGITNPDTLLHIYSTANPTLKIGDNADTGGTATLIFAAGNTSVNNAFQIQYIKNLTTDRLDIIDGSGGPRITMLNGGNLGLGTTSPGYTLDIAGSNASINISGTNARFYLEGNRVLEDAGSRLDIAESYTDTWLRSTASVLIGSTASPNTKRRLNLTTVSESGYFRIETYSNAALETPFMEFVKSAGTLPGTLSETPSGDILGRIDFKGVNNLNDDEHGAILKVVQDGGSGSKVPANLIINTFNASSENSNQFVLHNSGRIGMGTGNPQDTVHILQSGNAQILLERNSGTKLLLAAQSSNTQIGSSTNHNVQIITNGGARVTVNTSGRVGIGTSNPLNPLHIKSDTQPQLRLDTTGVLNAEMRFAVSGSDKYRIGLTNGTNELRFYDEVGLSTRLIINATGQIGIGMISPFHKLDVSGDFRVGNNANYEKLIFETGTASGGYNGLFLVRPSTIPGTGTALHLTHFSSSSSVGETRHDVSIDRRLGIGTTVPNEALTLEGVLSFDERASAPINTTGYGKLYVKASDGELYFKTSAGIETNLTNTSNLWTQNGSSIYYNSGNVGIGTTSPNDQFTVAKSSGSPIISIERPTSAWEAQLRFRTGSNIDWIFFENDSGNDLQIQRISESDSAPRIRFNGTNNDIVMALSGGNVGIGGESSTRLTLGSGIFTLKFINTDSNGLKIFQDSSDQSKILNFYNGPLILGTSDTERIRIDGSGHVGINKTNPATKLHIGNDPNDEGFRMSLSSISIFGGGYPIYGSNTHSYGADTSFKNIDANAAVGMGFISPMRTGTSTSRGGIFVKPGHAVAETVHTFSSFNPAITWNTNGFVGIGMENPTAQLQVSGDIATNSTSNKIFTNILQIVSSAANMKIHYSAADLYFESDIQESMRIKRDGKVGIGTITPDSLFNIVTESTGEQLYINRYQNVGSGANIKLIHARGTKASPAVVQLNDEAGYVQFNVYARNSGDTANQNIQTGRIISFVDSIDAQNRIGGAISFRTTPLANGSDVERMRISNTGNVGIGTFSPSYKLDVSGLEAANFGQTSISNIEGVNVVTISMGNSAEAGSDEDPTGHPSYGIRFNRYWGGSTVNHIAGIYAYGALSWGGGLYLQTKPRDGLSASSPITRMIINPNGNIGIHTLSPSGKLEINNALNNSSEGLIVNCATRTSGDNDVSAFRVIGGGGFSNLECFRINVDGGVSIGPGGDANFRVRITGTSGEQNLIISGDYVSTTTNAALYLSSGNAAISRIYMGDNNNLSSGRIDYSNASNYMAFLTNVNERMRINSSGQVGIGLTSPQNTLHLPWNSRIVCGQPTYSGYSGGATMWGTSSGDGYPGFFGRNLWSNGTNFYQASSNGSQNWGTSSGIYCTGVEPYFRVITVPASGNGLDYNLGTSLDAYTRLVVTGSGNVGIGTTNPSISGRGLEIFANNQTTEFKLNSNSSYYALFQMNYNAGNRFNLIVNGVPFLNVGSSHAVTINGGWDSAGHLIFKPGGTEHIRFTGSGNVGIGTGSPEAKLDIRGDIAKNDVIFEKVSRVNGLTSWVSIFTESNSSAQAVGFITISTIYGTPAAVTSRTVVMVRGNNTYSVIEQYGDSTNGYSGISFQWSGSTFQVRASNSSIYYSIKAELHSIGASYQWNHTWNI